MRHGQAAYSGLDRVLTLHGIKETELTAVKLASKLKITKIYASPKTRAQQTAETVLGKLRGLRPQLEQMASLTPAGDAALSISSVLSEARAEDNILLISHIPLVEELALYLCPALKLPLFVTSGALILGNNEEKWIPEAFICPGMEQIFDQNCIFEK